MGSFPYRTYYNVWGNSLIMRIVKYGMTPLSYVLQCMGALPYHADCNVWGHSLTIRIVMYGVTPLPNVL